MYLSITKIHLKHPGKLPLFFKHVNRITRQLKYSTCKRHKLKGGIMTHYTMTLWNTKEDMQAFVHSGAHLNSMKDIQRVSRNFITVTIDSYNLIPWNEAVAFIEKEEARRKKQRV